MNARELWNNLKNIATEYKEWQLKEETIKKKVRREIPFKEGHFHVLNYWRNERLPIDYRVVGYYMDDKMKYKVKSSILQYEIEGKDSIEEAYHAIRVVVESLVDEGGFSLIIIEEDNDTVYDFTSTLSFNQDLEYFAYGV